MARYIDADALLSDLKEELEFESPMYNEVENNWLNKGLRIAIKNVKHFPTADVVPRAEVEKIFEEIELFLNKAIDGWKKERRSCYHNRDIEMIDFRNDAFKYCLNEIAELKKKYTEEKK